MGQIDGEIIDKFRETAEELISARGPVETAAMLIAIATGNTKVKHQSLINSREVCLASYFECFLLLV